MPAQAEPVALGMGYVVLRARPSVAELLGLTADTQQPCSSVGGEGSRGFCSWAACLCLDGTAVGFTVPGPFKVQVSA